MGTKDKPGDYDCYGKALPDEPMFVLLARDIDAPYAVREWARNFRDRQPDDQDFDQEIERQRKYDEALNCAAAMERWRAKHPNAGGR